MEQQATAQQTWFANRKWGVFIHYLDQIQNASGDYHNTKSWHTGWDECVGDLNVELLARQLSAANAGYLIFTLQQSTQFLCAPNQAFESLTGCPRGEGTSTRDLIADLLDALEPCGIPLLLCFSGGGPQYDDRSMTAFYGRPARLAAGRDTVTDDFVQRWSSVLREYSLRYGRRIAGWYMDGLSPDVGYTPERIAVYKEAARAGNPNALFSANWCGSFSGGEKVALPGVGKVLFADFYRELQPPTPCCDFTAGESVALDVFPRSRLIGGAQAHILSALGIPPHPAMVYDGWSRRGCKYSVEYLMKYVHEVNSLGGVVSLDVCMLRDGHIDADQMRVLKMLAGLRRAPGIED